MNSSGVSAASSQPMGLPIAVASSQPMGLPIAVATPPPTVPGGNLKSCEEDKDKRVEYDPEFYENFSKRILRRRIAEFEGGKYTEKYMKVYLDFMVLSGFISNLEYLEFKNALDKGQL